MSSIWRKYHGALIPWKPPHLDIGLSRNEIKQEVKNNNAFFARWTSNFDSKKHAMSDPRKYSNIIIPFFMKY